MRRIVGIIGLSAGGWIGWELGALVSVFTGFLLSTVGAGVGLYIANRLNQRYLP